MFMDLTGSLAAHADGETLCVAGNELNVTLKAGGLSLIGKR